VKDFEPVILVAKLPLIMTVNANVSAKTVQEVIALAKAKPGELTFSSSGSGGAPHLAGELFKGLTQTKIQHVPYRGSGPAVIDLIAGRITMMFDATPSLWPHIQSGKLRPIAAASPQRHRLLPDVPSFAELGYPAMDIALWYGVAVPGGTPAPIVQRLNAELVKILEMPDVRKTLGDQGADLQGGSPEDFGTFMRSESTRWGIVVKQAGIKSE
jgi:tripartite-type tricarboxylate transporter receptor subunit TctC